MELIKARGRAPKASMYTSHSYDDTYTRRGAGGSSLPKAKGIFIGAQVVDVAEALPAHERVPPPGSLQGR